MNEFVWAGRGLSRQWKYLWAVLVIFMGINMPGRAQQMTITGFSPSPACLGQQVTLDGIFEDTCQTTQFRVTDGSSFSSLATHLNDSTLTFTLPSTLSQSFVFIRVIRSYCGPIDSSAFIQLPIGIRPVISIPVGNYCTSYSDPIPLSIQNGSNLAFNYQAGPGVFSITPNGEIYLGANASQGNYKIVWTNSGSCTYSDSVYLAITLPDTAQLAYPAPAFCQSGATILPTTASPANGTFSSSAGLDLQTNIGQVDLGMSAPGSYIVQYQPHQDSLCMEPTQTLLEIVNDTLYFQYPAGPFCPANTSQINIASQSGNVSPGGFFSWSNTNAPGAINSTNGSITVNSSFAGLGPFSVVFTSNNPICPGRTYTSPSSIVFDSIFTYDLASGPVRKFCQRSSLPFTLGFTPTFGNTAPFPLPAQGGFTSSPGGLSIGGSSGVVTPASSDPGFYTISYQPGPGECASVDTTQIEIVEHRAEFAYAASSYCKCVETVTPSLSSGTAGGQYVAVPPGLDIDPLNGTIRPSQSSIDTYTVYYIYNDPPCNDTLHQVTVTITDSIALTFDYPDEPFCTDTTDSIQVIQPNIPGGSFSSAILNNPYVHPTTGAIKLNTNMAPGPRSIVYHLENDPCPCLDTVTINLHERESAYFYYKDSTEISTICRTESPLEPNTVLATPGGIFKNESGWGLDLKTSSGKIFPGSPINALDTLHSISYTTQGRCPSTHFDTIKVVASFNPNFTYGKTSFCPHDSIATVDLTNGFDFGGEFSCDDPGLIFDVDSGTIDILASLPGNYTLKYFISVSGTNQCDIERERPIEIKVGPSLESLDHVFDPPELCGDQHFTLEALYRDSNNTPVYGHRFIVDGDTASGQPRAIEDTLPTGDHEFIVLYISPNECYTVLKIPKFVHPIPKLSELPTEEVIIEANIPFLLPMSSSEGSTVFHWKADTVVGTDLIVPAISGETDLKETGQYEMEILVDVPKPLSTGEATFSIWTSLHSCPSITSVVKFRIVPPENSLFIPGAFTPNGDGTNDVWKFTYTDDIDGNDYLVRLFNRAGARVYENNLADMRTDGYNGNGLPDGVYRYMVVDLQGNLFKKGGLTIKRR